MLQMEGISGLKPFVNRKRRACVLLPVTLGLFAMGACSIDDKDRCGEGLIYDSDVGVCYADTGTGGGSNTGGNGGEDGSGGDAPGGQGGETGGPSDFLGKACNSDADCAEAPDATFCVLNPQSPTDPGTCSIPNCVAADCGSSHACCDCANLAILEWPGPVCVENDRQMQLESFGCSCE